MTIATSNLLSGSVLDEEIRLEERAISDGVARYNRNANKSIKRGDGAALKPAERLLVHWFEPLVAAIKKDQAYIGRGKPAVGVHIWGGVFRAVDPERLAVIALHEMIGQCMKNPDGVLSSRLAYTIGRAVVAEMHLDMMRARDKETRERRQERIDAGEDKQTVYKQEREALKDLDRRFRSLSPGRVNWWAKKTLNDPQWNRQVCTHVGARLVYHVCDVASVASDETNFELAFHRERKKTETDEFGRTVQLKKQPGIIRMDEKAMDVIDQGHEVRQFLRPRFLPMVVKPYPWETDANGHPTTEGGYVRVRTPFVSKPTKEQKAALEKADLSIVCKALSAIGSVGWRINNRVFETIAHVWTTGGGELGIPHLSNVPDVTPPKLYDPAAPLRERWANVDPEEKRTYKLASSAVKAENIARIAAREEFLAKLDIANRFRDHEAIYFPHQFDFRGRMYAIPIHLNHQGDDVCRGLLEFAEAKKPGERGLWWLKVHAANCFGMDTVSFKARVQWVDDHMDAIRRSAEDPMGFLWWMSADESEPGAHDGKPWQFLAACIALMDPDGAGAHLPVQVDGTCNGLQWYTALGRDERAAPAVNMAGPADEPQSVYVHVGRATDKIVRRDSLANGTAAAMIDRVGSIGKPLVKDETMTTCYGVTEYGARRQAAKALGKMGFEGDELYKASMYLKGAVLEGIGDVCNSAITIMDWFRACAGIVARAGRLFTATSPIGFPMVQPYRHWKSMKISTVLQKVIIQVETDDVPVSVSEHIDGSAPNIIHMLDATHLMLTAIDCAEHDVTLAGVHDADWSHAATMDFVHDEAIPRNLVKINQRNILDELVAEWRALHPDLTFPDPPPRGTLDINLVLTSPYTFH